MAAILVALALLLAMSLVATGIILMVLWSALTFDFVIAPGWLQARFT